MAAEPFTDDPRRAEQVIGERDIRPVVQLPRAGASRLVIAGGALAAGLILFAVLDARRHDASAPATSFARTDLALGTAPPPLYIPPEPAAPTATFEPQVQPAPLPVPSVPPRATLAPSAPTVVYVPQAAPAPVEPPRNAGGPALVADTSSGVTPAASSISGAAGGASGSPPAFTTDRANAGMLANRATTVAQGTLIPAVLETAFDSTRSGFARALVQRDVRGFDGTLVLIPRGSRLIGEYASDAAPGQKRAMIAWSRLIRPDGATIAIGSPAADPVGRGGVRAEVNSHFLERFAGAILQSTLDVGVNLASRAGNSPVILALPGSVGGTGAAALRSPEIPPTLRVPQGTSVSVFVARDLDFTAAQNAP